MKYLRYLASAVLTMTLGVLFYLAPKPNKYPAVSATGAIFLEGKFECSGVEIGSLPEGDGIFLTARHCATTLETNEVHQHMMVSFTPNQDGPFYRAEPVAISLTEDIALLRLHNGAGLPVVHLEDDRILSNHDLIYNVSFPMSAGKMVFHGEYVASQFSHFPEVMSDYSVWAHAMPMNLTIAHGSSGSGVYDSKTDRLVGIAVGTFGEGSFNVAMPSHRIMYFLNDLKDNTVDKFVVYNPIKEAPMDFFKFF